MPVVSHYTVLLKDKSPRPGDHFIGSEKHMHPLSNRSKKKVTQGCLLYPLMGSMSGSLLRVGKHTPTLIRRKQELMPLEVYVYCS